MSNKNSHKKKGFTLLEVITVIIILGAVAALAIPNLRGTIEKSKLAEGKEILIAVLSGIRAYQIDPGGWPLGAPSIAALDVAIPNSANFNAPTIILAAPTGNEPIASVQRNNTGPAYTLNINQDGTITCTPAGTTCRSLGY